MFSKATLILSFILTSIISIKAQTPSIIHNINHIGILKEDNFEDLEPLGEAIGAYQMVALEDWASATDGSTYEAIGRIMAYLHQEKGFDMILWPIGLFEGQLMQEAFEANNKKEALLNLYRVWKESVAINELADYIIASQKSGKTLEVMGASCQFHAYSKDQLFSYFNDPRSSDIFNTLNSDESNLFWKYWNRHKRLKNLTKDELIQLKTLAEKLNQHKTQSSLSTQIVKNISWFVELELIRGHYPANQLESAASSWRRETTIKNLDWLFKNKLKDKKILLFGYWSELQEKLGEEIFTIGFTAYQGATGRPGQDAKPLAPAKENSLEYQLHQNKQAYQLYFPQEDEVYFPSERLKKNGKNAFQAIFFIDQAFPNKKIEASVPKN